MIKDFAQAFLGKWEWGRLKRLGADWYFIMPHTEEEYNEYALLYTDAFLDSEKADSLCIVTCDEEIYKKALGYKGGHRVTALYKGFPYIYRLIKLYALYEFSNRVKIISLTMPYDTCGENLLGVHGVTKRELLCYDIFGFREIPNHD